MYLPFEGSENKLELILRRPHKTIRDNRDGKWDRVAKAAGFTIVSHISIARVDAYLLGEASLFVWSNRILMINGGKALLTDALPEILRFIDPKDIMFALYERKNLTYPLHQTSNFETEAAFVQTYFPGKSYRMGPANHEHWHIFLSDSADNTPMRDVKLQILMTNIAPCLLEVYAEKPPAGFQQEGKLSWLNTLYPEATADCCQFSPCGYSMNAVFDSSYYTVHITPQTEGSYASFETNIMEKYCPSLIRVILRYFKPGNFSLVLTTTKHEEYMLLHKEAKDQISGYKISDISNYQLGENFIATFVNFEQTMDH